MGEAYATHCRCVHSHIQVRQQKLAVEEGADCSKSLPSWVCEGVIEIRFEVVIE